MQLIQGMISNYFRYLQPCEQKQLLVVRIIHLHFTSLWKEARENLFVAVQRE